MINTGSLSHEKAISATVKGPIPFSRKTFGSTSMQVLIHILMWLLLLSLIMTLHLFSRLFGTARVPLPFLYKSGILLVLHVGLFYFNALYAIPKLLFRKKILWFIMAVILAVAVVQFANYQFSSYLRLEARLIREFQLDSMSGRIIPSAPPFAMRVPLGNPEPRMIDVFAWLTTFIILG